MSSNGNILVLRSDSRSVEPGSAARASSQGGAGSSRRSRAKQAEPRAGKRVRAKGAVAADHKPVANKVASANRSSSAADNAADSSVADARTAAREEARAKRAAARERAQRRTSGKQGSVEGFSVLGSKGEKGAAPASAKDRVAAVAGGGAQGVLAWIMAHKKLSAVIVAVVALMITVYPPACSLYSATRSNAILSAKLADATTTADTLQSEVDNLMTREGIEDEARRRGYVSEGETAVDMSGVEDTGSASSDSTVTESTSDDSTGDPWYIKALDFIFRYDPSTQGLGK